MPVYQESLDFSPVTEGTASPATKGTRSVSHHGSDRSRSSDLLIGIDESITQLVAKATTLAKEAIPMRVEKAHENWLWPLDRQQRDPVAMDREGRHDELLSTLHVQTQIVNSARDVVEAALFFCFCVCSL